MGTQPLSPLSRRGPQRAASPWDHAAEMRGAGESDTRTFPRPQPSHTRHATSLSASPAHDHMHSILRPSKAHRSSSARRHARARGTNGGGGPIPPQKANDSRVHDPTCVQVLPPRTTRLRRRHIYTQKPHVCRRYTQSATPMCAHRAPSAPRAGSSSTCWIELERWVASATDGAIDR